jgi:FkbM family methyltransferase
MAQIALRFSPDESSLGTLIGKRTAGAIVIDRCDKGAALYGPYIGLRAGDYLASVRLDGQKKLAGSALMDVVYARGEATVASAELDLREAAGGRAVLELPFTLGHAVPDIEVRLQCLQQVSATILGVELTRLDPLTGNPGSSLSPAATTTDLGRRLDELELLCRGGATYVGNNRVLVKVVVGDAVLAFLMPADDLLLMPSTVVHGAHEQPLTDYFAANVTQGDHCLDIGANYGYFTCLMARLASRGRTIGVEPNPPLFELARDNIHINSLQVAGEALHAAVSDQAGKLTLYRRLTRSGNTSIGRVSDEFTQYLGEPEQEAFSVDSVPIDALLDRLGGRLDMMKIDVEGAEPLAFRGAQRTVAANPRLKIVMEWSPGQIQHAGFDVREFLTALASMGLQAATIHDRGALRPIPIMDLLQQSYLAGVLLHREQ